jgi:HK97 family phage major capsid protein
VITERNQHRSRLNKAWRMHLEGRFDDSIPELRDITSNTSAGGSLVPNEFQSGFVSAALKHFAPLAQFVRTRVSSNGRPVKVSRVTDTAHGMVLINEGGGTSVPEVDPTFSSSDVFTDAFSTGQIRFSNQLLQDSAFDMEQFLTGLADIRYGRGLEAILTRGVDSSGTTTPNNPGILSVAAVGTTTATLAAGVGYKDLVNLFDALDVGYLPRAVWMMTSKTRNVLLASEDSTSRSYYVPAPNVDGLDMLLGKPIVINQSLDQLGTANAIPIVFGSLWDGYEMISSDLRVTTLRERYADVNESALIASTRVGSAGLATGALQSLKLAAS